MNTEHDFDGHGGCAPGCRQCRIEEQAVTIARLEGERDALTARVAKLEVTTDAAREVVKAFNSNDTGYQRHAQRDALQGLAAALKEHP